MNKKYELTNITKEYNGVTLHRIRALIDFNDVKKGNLGGWVEKESNLSQYGNCWIYDEAMVYENTEVLGDAIVCGDAEVFGNSEVLGDAIVCGDAKEYGDAEVFGNAIVCGDAKVYGDAMVYGDAEVLGDSEITKNLIGKMVYKVDDYI